MQNESQHIADKAELVERIPEVVKIVPEAASPQLDDFQSFKENHIDDDKETQGKLDSDDDEVRIHRSQEESEIDERRGEVDHIWHEDLFEDFILILFPKQVDYRDHLSG